MKKILMSIQPKWCEKIFSGEKTIEVRRNRPKLEPPFTVYVYCTKAKNIREDGLYLLPNDKELYLGCKEKDLGFVCWEGDFRNGKVIGSFVCDEIYAFFPWGAGIACEDIDGNLIPALKVCEETCLTGAEIYKYFLGNGKETFEGYGWHITEPKLFDKPKEFYELYAPCKKNKQTADENCKGCSYAYKGVTTGEIYCDNALIRPPQSFCYVEEY